MKKGFIKAFVFALSVLMLISALVSCNRKNAETATSQANDRKQNDDNPIVISVDDISYTLSDYYDAFDNGLYSYFYSGEEEEYNPDFSSQTSEERLEKYQDYVYEQFVVKAVKLNIAKANGIDPDAEDFDDQISRVLVEKYGCNASDAEAEVQFNTSYQFFYSIQGNLYYKLLDDYLNGNSDGMMIVKDGYYFVKHILIAADDTDTRQAVEKEITKINQMSGKKKKLEAFDKLIERYGTDPGMQAEPTKSTGYLMGDGNPMVDEFSQASEKLYAGGKGKVGDISGAVESYYGIHYIQIVKILEPSTFESCKEMARAACERQKVQNYLSDMEKSQKITVDWSVLRQVGKEYVDTYFTNN